MKLALPSPPLCNVVQLFDLLVRNIKKNSTFGGGVGVVGVNCSVLWSYPFKDNVYTICCRLLVVSPTPFPPPLNAHALPILPQWYSQRWQPQQCKYYLELFAQKILHCQLRTTLCPCFVHLTDFVLIYTLTVRLEILVTEATRSSSAVLPLDTRVCLFIDPTAMPCWRAPIRAKQLSMAATAWVIWLCACVRYGHSVEFPWS